MLQQTRVEAVKGYYTRFLNAVPDIASLAGSDQELLHKLWEGLGYYSRVRNLQAAAKEILQLYGGEFPRTYREVRALKGIGDYTAGAICSICFDLPTPAVDGNVLRVLSRMREDPRCTDDLAVRRSVRDELAAVYPESGAGTLTPALMELGATVCVPNGAPKCEECPLASLCRAHAEGLENELPVKAAKKERRVEPRTVLLIERNGKFAIAKRPNRGLLASLWEFPNLAGGKNRTEILAFCKKAGLPVKSARRMKAARHIFTHIEWRLSGWHILLKDDSEAAVKEPRAPFGSAPLPPLTWATRQELSDTYSIPVAFHAYIPQNT